MIPSHWSEDERKADRHAVKDLMFHKCRRCEKCGRCTVCWHCNCPRDTLVDCAPGDWEQLT